MFHFIFGLSITVLATLLSGCGVERAIADKDLFTEKTLRDFPPEDLHISDATFFLWKENVTSSTILKVKEISQAVDALDVDSLRLGKNFEIAEKEIVSQGLKEEKKALKRQYNSALGDQVELSRAEIPKLKKQLAELEENNELRQELEQKLIKLEGKLRITEASLSSIEKELSRVEDEFAELNDIQRQKKENALKIAKHGSELKNLVHYFEQQPSFVDFLLEPDGSWRVHILGWTIDKIIGDRNYSTLPEPGKKPTIGQVNYQRIGGQFNFEVYVYEDKAQRQLRETYVFNIARTQYDDPEKKEFKYLGGEIKVKVKEKPRKGLALLVDRE